jgi:NIPSNAP
MQAYRHFSFKSQARDYSVIQSGLFCLFRVNFFSSAFSEDRQCRKRGDKFMDRRTLLTSSLAASALAGTGGLQTLGAPSPEGMERDLYELRLYHLRRGPQVKRMNDFMKDAYIPAMKRAGAGPIGAFNVTIGPESPTLYLLITFKSHAALAHFGERLMGDEELRKGGAAVIDTPATDPAFIRAESSLLVAFPGMPHLEIPPSAAQHKSRIFELRTYESHSKKANLTKIGMFGEGEIAIFRRSGLRPVFFGETLFGTNLPNLTYLLTYDDMAARERDWAAFVADPEWKKLSTTPGYTDAEIVSNITNRILTPTDYSEI